jgi:hypothetical protein
MHNEVNKTAQLDRLHVGITGGGGYARSTPLKLPRVAR